MANKIEKIDNKKIYVESINNQGITLISVVITIIVLLILTSVSIALLLGETGILNQANKAKIISEFSSYEEAMKLVEADDVMNDLIEGKKQTSLRYNIYSGQELAKILPNVEQEIMDRIMYIDGEMIYIADEINQDVIEIENAGYQIILKEDVNYRIELEMIENLVELTNIYGYEQIGKQIETIYYPNSVYVGLNKFGAGWNILGNGDTSSENTNIIKEIEELGVFELTEEDKMYLKNSPYLVTYENEYVQSINGKMTSVGTDREKIRYSYNYDQEDGYLSNNIFTAITEDSEKDADSFGEFSSVNKDSDLEYREDKYGHTGLVTGENPVSVPLDDKEVHVNEEYTLSILVEGPTNQGYPKETCGSLYPDGVKYFGGTVIAISSGWDKYTAWISVAENYLRVYAYSTIDVTKGFTYVDISEYQDKFMHIQLTAQNGGEAQLYINGELKSTFLVDNYTFDNTEVTLGDLRPGRGLMYTGTIYDVIVYDRILTEQELLNTWKYVKTEYNIDETGTQY